MAEEQKIRALPAKLSFFQPEIFQDTIESSLLEDHFPVGFQTNNLFDPIKFDVRGTDRWMDLENAYFAIEGTIIGNDETNSSAHTDALNTATLQIVNNFFPSLFTTITTSLNNSATTFDNGNYQYLDYLTKLFNLTQDAQSIYGRLFTWTKDTAAKMEATDDTNEGSKARRSWIDAGNKIRGSMKLCSPLFQMKPYLLPFLNLTITMERTSKHDFLFLSPTRSNFQFRIDKIVLKIRKVKTVTAFTTSIEHMMHKLGRHIEYPLKKATVFTKTYSGYGTDLIEDNLFHGILPERVIFGFVDDAAANGAKSRNPFHFKNKGITEVGLKINGVPFPHQPLVMNFTNNDYMDAYHQFMNSFRSINSVSNSVFITPEEYKSGYTLFSFDMSSDQRGGVNRATLYNEPANVQLHIKFAQSNATDTIVLIVYYETSSRVAVDSSRQVQVYSR